MSWKDLDIKQKAELIKLGVQSGIRDINQIRQLYDDSNTPTQVIDQSYNETNVMPMQGIERIKQEYDTPEEGINKANAIIQQIENEISLEEINNQQPVQFRQFKNGGKVYNPPFMQRILNNDNRSVADWENPNRTSTHKLSYAQTDEGYIVYPEVQIVDGQIHDFTDPKYNHGKWDALDNAIRNSDTLRFSTEEQALRYTQEYKNKYPEYFKQFNKGGYISNNPTQALVGKVKKYDEGGQKDSSIIQDYIFNGPLKRKKENSLEYRQALFNNVDPRNGYPSPWTAVKYYNTVVDALNAGDTSKKWETDGSIGQETAAAGWAKFLDLPYNKQLFPVWNGDTVRLSPELEREIPVDTNLLKQDIQEIRYNRDMDRSMGIFDREEAYKILLQTKQLALNNLRKTYKTGEWVQMNEFMGNSVNPFDWNEGYVSPLNVLQFYGQKYDKNTNSMLYGDQYNLNAFDYFLPGKPFMIRGSIPLDKKKNGGFLFPNQAFSHKFEK